MERIELGATLSRLIVVGLSFGVLQVWARTVEDARRTRPVATAAYAAETAAKKVVGEWLSHGRVVGRVLFEETRWTSETLPKNWERYEAAVFKTDERGVRYLELVPDGKTFVKCVQNTKALTPMKAGRPIAVLWEARTPRGGSSAYFRYDIYDADGNYVSSTQQRSTVDPTQPQTFERNAFVLTPSRDQRIGLYFHLPPEDEMPADVANVRIVDLGDAVAASLKENQSVLEARRQAGDSIAWFSSSDLTAGYPVMPVSTHVPGAAFGPLRMVDCRGETVHGGLVLWSKKAQPGVCVGISELKRKGEDSVSIPAAAVSVRVVKCHYQAEGAPSANVATGEDQVLVPELLLNDDSLVVPDHATRRNFVRLAREGGAEYIDINSVMKYGWSDRVPNSEMPISDAPTLCPFALEAGLNKQLAVSVRVPKTAKPGIYAGTLQIRAEKTLLASVPLELRVLGFELPLHAETKYSPNREYTMGVYVWTKVSEDGSDSLSPWARSREQVLSVYRTLYVNGIRDPAFIWSTDIVYDERRFRQHLEIAREAGFSGKLHLGSSGLIGNSTNKAELAEMQERLVKAMSVAREYGFEEVYFYGFDEAYGDKLLSQRVAWKAAKEVGAKIIVSGGNGHFEKVGDLLDICVYHEAPENARPSDWHLNGNRIWKYGTPQTAPEDPGIYRRNYGLYLWNLGFDGGNTYCEMSGFSWNDLVSLQRNKASGKSGSAYRSECIMYPTTDGVIETMALHGLEAAIKDVRYMTKFRQLLRRYPNEDASKWAREIDYASADPMRIRYETIQWILKLDGD